MSQENILKQLYKGTIRYDGSAFHGWQKQPNLTTVQGKLEDCLSLIAREKVYVQGASRTDAGVHALGQTFTFFWKGVIPKRLKHAISEMLAPNAKITSLEAVPNNFDVCKNVKWKKYSYQLALNKEPDPFTYRYSWQIPYDLDLNLLENLLKKLEGTHDFAGFQSSGSQMETTIRTIYSAKLLKGCILGDINSQTVWRIELVGDRFLYRMVRNITGTLVEIARGRFKPEFFDECLYSNKKFLGYTAPPQGLILVEINYYPTTNDNVY
ncbi:MAG: tRNA pseudouridine(38-40) synthase TruA [Candidatus Hydrogenedentes bacterium]|nr:tRNA pseudouridine(38-40) synthase TruA [Candidatus Hydrogenedentota bacterium]